MREIEGQRLRGRMRARETERERYRKPENES